MGWAFIRKSAPRELRQRSTEEAEPPSFSDSLGFQVLYEWAGSQWRWNRVFWMDVTQISTFYYSSFPVMIYEFINVTYNTFSVVRKRNVD